MFSESSFGDPKSRFQDVVFLAFFQMLANNKRREPRFLRSHFFPTMGPRNMSHAKRRLPYCWVEMTSCASPDALGCFFFFFFWSIECHLLSISSYLLISHSLSLYLIFTFTFDWMSVPPQLIFYTLSHKIYPLPNPFMSVSHIYMPSHKLLSYWTPLPHPRLFYMF